VLKIATVLSPSGFANKKKGGRGWQRFFSYGSGNGGIFILTNR
jgi:hypothetical protein